jgi:hypothetical protein
MTLSEFFEKFPKLADWYLGLAPVKRIQLNYIFILAITITLSYYNDKRHRENYTALSARIDVINDTRSKEQERYTAKLEFYTDKFNNLLEILIQQRQKIERIEEEKK